jgi:hypothetical protein
VIEKDQPECEPPEQVQPQIASGRHDNGGMHALAIFRAAAVLK